MLLAIPWVIMLLQAPVVAAEPPGSPSADGVIDRFGKPVGDLDAVFQAPDAHDQYGRPIHEARGERRNYTLEETDGLKALFGVKASREGSSGSGVPFKNMMTIGLEWHRSIYGVGIGDSGLTAADLDGDGGLEVVAGAGPRDFGKNDFWYVMRYDGSGYPQVWARHQYDDTIRSLRATDLDADGDAEVLVGVGQDILIYDGIDPVLIQTIATAASEIRGLTIVDVDLDGALELIFCDASTLFVYDLATGAQEYQGAGFGGLDIAVGDVDVDGGLEIVVGNGTNTGRVFDGATRAVEWTRAGGFGDHVDVGDFDSDGMLEIVAAFRWNDISVFDADLQTLAYMIPVTNELGAMKVLDVEGDGPLEIVYGNGQWGSLHAHNGATGALKWSHSNPEHGVTDLDVADVDGDGTPELLWGAGFSSSGEDFLFVVDTVSLVQEWQNVDITGPFRGLDYGDLDGDGERELLYGSFESDSGYSDGLYFVHDAATRALEFASGEPTGSNWTGLWRLRQANIDGDPQNELFVTTSTTYTGKIIAYDGLTHAEQWQLATESGLTFQAMQVADVDGDGGLEIIASTGREHTGASGVYLYVYDAATGALEWQSPSLGANFVDYPLLRVADVDGDAVLEMLVGRLGGELQVFDGVSHVQELATGDLNLSALDTPDRDGDGTAEILIGTDAGFIQVLDPTTGAVLETVGSHGADIDGLDVADLDLDGTADYIFGVADEVRVQNGASGIVVWSSGDIGTSTGDQDSLLVDDVDDDGNLEIFVNLGEVGVRLYEVDLTNPEVAINAPTDGSTYLAGVLISFDGTATDVEDGDLTANLGWSSDLDGSIGVGGIFEAALSAGSHVITASVTDSGGLVGEDMITLTIDPNTPPSVTISAPTDGSISIETESVVFAGTATDAEDGDLTAGLSWSSDLDGAIGSGGSFSLTTLSVGSHVITASVTDIGGSEGSDTITVTVNANTLPVVTITAPADGSTSIETEPVAFVGTATDAEDGDLTASLAWSSSLDGTIGTGGSPTVSNLSVGTHLITAEVIDSHNGFHSTSITVTVNANTAPSVAITSPSGVLVFVETDPVSFAGTATDAEDGDLTASLTWSSSLDGVIGTGGSFSLTTLSVGSHVITASVTDSHGAVGSANVTLTVDANTAPSVVITSPSGILAFVETDPVSFAGTASDVQDGNLTASLAWTSSLDGTIGTGGSFSLTTLSVGTHVITASVTDSHGAVGSANITLSVDANTPPSVAITSPNGILVFVETDPVPFTGTASDVQDGDLTANLAWTSSLDGAIGSGGSFAISTLSVGTHVITASVTDSHGAAGSDSVTLTVNANTAPSVGITAPAGGTLVTIGDLVTFTGAASDLEDGDLSAVIAWSSSLDGAIGSGASVGTSSLSQGVHTITAMVVDSHGLGASDAIDLRVLGLPVEITVTSIGLDDGRVRESSETSDVGGQVRSTNTNNRALRVGDDKKDRQFKSFVSFDTSSVPGGAVIVSANLRLRRGKLSGTNPFTTHGICRVDVQTGGFGGDVALAASDFQAAATVVAAATLSNAASSGDWSEGTLDAAGLAAIDRAGTTQMRVYFDLDDNDDRGNDYVGYYSGEHSTAANHPQLVITYQE